MSKISKLEALNIKLFLATLKLKEDKSYSLKETEIDESLVFVFKNKEALCRFLTDKNIDISSPQTKDIVNHDLIIKEFDNGTIICPKVLCQYLCTKAQEKVNKNLKHSKKIKSKVKFKTSYQY